MAGELQVQRPVADEVLYVIARNKNALAGVVSTGAFEAYSSANRAAYAIALTEGEDEDGNGTGFHKNEEDFPFGAGAYYLYLYKQTGGAVAESPTDTPIGSTPFPWDGSSEITLFDLGVSGDGNGISPGAS